MSIVSYKDIPVSGERYDLTLDVVGKSREGTFVAQWIIDNGDRRGVRVSHRITEDECKSLKPLVKRHRVSAVVTVHASMKDAGVWLPVDPEEAKSNLALQRQAQGFAFRYSLADFGEPSADSELGIVLNRNKFVRE